jgi:hypothetical protein
MIMLAGWMKNEEARLVLGAPYIRSSFKLVL